MQVVGEHHDRIDAEWMRAPRDTKCSPQRIDVIRQERGVAIGERHGEEVFGPWDPRSAIVRHNASLVILRRDAVLRALKPVYENSDSVPTEKRWAEAHPTTGYSKLDFRLGSTRD